MFQIHGLPDTPFAPLFGLPEGELAARGIRRVLVTEPNAAPCRVGLADAEPGQTVLLLNHVHQPADTPYRASHAIYVREGAVAVQPAPGTVPEMIRRRLLSVRAFGPDHMIVDAEVVEGAVVAPLLADWVARPDVAYIHLHFARRGCFAATVLRA